MMSGRAPSCGVCGGQLRHKLKIPKTRIRIVECRRCGTWVLEDQPTTPERLSMYHGDYYESWGSSGELAGPVHEMKRRTFECIFRELARHKAPGRLLDVGCALGSSLAAAQGWGWDADGLEVNPHAAALASKTFGSRIICSDFESAELEEWTYDAVLMSDVLEHLPNPVRAMAKVSRLLRADGVVVITTPCNQSLSAKLMRGFWPHLKTEHLFYFSRRGMSILLEKSGFRCVCARPGLKALNLQYVDHIMGHYEVAWLSPCVRTVISIVPKRWQVLNFYTRSGDLFAIGRKVEQPARR